MIICPDIQGHMIVAFLFCVVDDEGIKLTADVLATCLLVDTEVVNIKCFDSVKDMTFLKCKLTMNCAKNLNSLR